MLWCRRKDFRMRTLYVTCPAYAMRGPLDRQFHLDQVAWVAQDMGWKLVPSPLLDRHLGPGAWLPVAERARDLKRALAHDVVWACRGGYGSLDLVETVLKAKQQRGPRLIGYSDITALHGAFAVRGWHERAYGSVATAPRRAGRAGTTLVAWLRGGGFARDGAMDAGVQVLVPGRARGRLFAACLSVLASLAGTPAMPDLAGCVLAIEDIKSQPFLIATHLTQLHLSGALTGVRALVGGTFTHAEDHDYLGPRPDEVLAEWGRRLRVPTLGRLPFGHLDDGLVLPYDRQATVEAGRDGRWTVTVHPAR
jgi:muramoyltetrapeptide carboxypeptidase